MIRMLQWALSRLRGVPPRIPHRMMKRLEGYDNALTSQVNQADLHYLAGSGLLQCYHGRWSTSAKGAEAVNHWLKTGERPIFKTD